MSAPAVLWPVRVRAEISNGARAPVPTKPPETILELEPDAEETAPDEPA